MKILVIGGAGFIGSHIVDSYIKLGHKVVVIDNLKTGFKNNLNKKAKFYRTDIRNLKSIKQIFKKEKFDIVNHHAAIAEVIKSIKNPLLTIETNVLGTINLLVAGSENKIKKFIFASTGGAIYGEPEKIPVDENAPAEPLSPYGLSKLLAEESIKFYAKNFSFDYLIFRYGNVYGPRQNPKGEAGVIAIFSYLIKNNKQPIIFGDGSKTRDYVYVKDIVKANALGLSKGKNDIINLGCGKEISDFKVFETISKNLNPKIKPIFAHFRPGEVKHITLSNKKAYKVLGWKPQIKFEQGVKIYLKEIL